MEGIGSRFFTVLNSGADPLGQTRDQLAAAPAMARGDAAVLAGLAPAREGVWGRTGFDLATAFRVIYPVNGVRSVQIDAQDRLELWFGPVDGGHLVANGTLRDLPPGSRLDPVTGQFTWAPGPGYLGTYRLAFLRGAEQILVDVTIQPPAGDRHVRMFVDTPQARQVVEGTLTIGGWAFDPQAFTGAGIDAVHVLGRADVGAVAVPRRGDARRVAAGRRRGIRRPVRRGGLRPDVVRARAGRV